MKEWFKRRWESLLDNLIWAGLVALALAGGSILAFGGQHLTLHVWEVVLVGCLFTVVGVCFVLLFRRVSLHERRSETSPASPPPRPPAPKRFAGLLTEIRNFERDLEDVNQGQASWHFAEIYHELRQRAFNEAPSVRVSLGTLPEIAGAPGHMAMVQVGDLRLYLRRMATLLEQAEGQHSGRQTRAVIQ